MIIHVYEPQEILMNNTCLKNKTPSFKIDLINVFHTVEAQTKMSCKNNTFYSPLNKEQYSTLIQEHAHDSSQ